MGAESALAPLPNPPETLQLRAVWGITLCRNPRHNTYMFYDIVLYMWRLPKKLPLSNSEIQSGLTGKTPYEHRTPTWTCFCSTLRLFCPSHCLSRSAGYLHELRLKMICETPLPGLCTIYSRSMCCRIVVLFFFAGNRDAACFPQQDVCEH